MLTVAVSFGLMESANAGAFVQVPESGGTFVLLALAFLGVVAMRRKFAK
jgi:protein with PEP-CTERM/exosortase system signal